MLHVWKLIVTSHRRKKHVIWLFICAVFVFLLIPLINSISLWEGWFVNTSFQHQITEIIGLLFVLYFWSTILQQLNHNKIIQLLRSKRKEPISFVTQIWLGTYSIYAIYIIITCLIALLLQWPEHNILIWYSNLLISGAIVLTVVMLLSIVTNSYAAMVWSLIIYSISYSINFIIFSTPLAFQETISYKILTILQYLFPRFDMLYSTSNHVWERLWSIWWNILYLLCIFSLFIYVFLRRYNK